MLILLSAVFSTLFDPSFDAKISPIEGLKNRAPDDSHERWDHASVHEFSGTYGEYLLAKVSKVFRSYATAEARPRRLFLQALIHLAVGLLAVGLYHCKRGNPIGASRQLHKGLKKLAKCLPVCEGIDTGRRYQESLAALEQIEAGVPLPLYPKIHTSSAAGS